MKTPARSVALIVAAFPETDRVYILSTGSGPFTRGLLADQRIDVVAQTASASP